MKRMFVAVLLCNVSMMFAMHQQWDAQLDRDIITRALCDTIAYSTNPCIVRDPQKCEKSLEEIQALIDAGADVNGSSSVQGVSRVPLFVAVSNPEIVSLLLAKGARVDARGTMQSLDEGDTALHYAVTANQLKSLELLLDAGADVNAQNAKGRTPLHVAAEAERQQCVALLLIRGANPAIADQSGMTAFERAAYVRANIASYARGQFVQSHWE